MALERVAVHLPLAHNRLDGALRPQDHEDQAQGHLSGHDDPLQDADLGPLLLVCVDVVPQEHDDRHHPARQRSEGGTEKVDSVAKERDEVSKKPSTKECGDHHGVPCCKAPFPGIVGTGILLLCLRKHCPTEDNAFDQVRYQHVNQHAKSSSLKGCVEWQVLVDHAFKLIPQVVIAPETCDHKGNQLEWCGDIDICLRQFMRIFHLRNDLGQHKLGCHSKCEGAKSGEHPCRCQVGKHDHLGAFTAHCIRTFNHKVHERDENGPAQRNYVDPDQRLVGTHLPRRSCKR
mmetsp:Transcript_59236/g.149970  ORF Transcript_59236/g.149970 Transcript_59236/m.149970 type:complete len:288 (-) Transcript_59236:110-973(-)